MNYNQQDLKNHVLKVFQYFIGICEEYNLRYFCSGGTAIGAVRHNGMIPWDDDVDVLMPRDDYNKLKGLQQKMSAQGFNILSVENCEYMTQMKLYDTNTTLWELKSIPFIYGVYIDIFPMDLSDISPEEFLRTYKTTRNITRKMQVSAMSFTFKDIWQCFREKDNKMLVKGLASFFFPHFRTRHYQGLLIELEKRHNKAVGTHYVSYYGDYWQKEYLPKEWFDEYEVFPFESFYVRLPKGWKEYLTMVFGDYMKLPPIEKQKTHHYHYFLDLEKSLSIDEVRPIMMKDW